MIASIGRERPATLTVTDDGVNPWGALTCTTENAKVVAVVPDRGDASPLWRSFAARTAVGGSIGTSVATSATRHAADRAATAGRMRAGTLECILTGVRTSHDPIGGQAVLPYARTVMPNLPSGTVTFLFSDIEGSTTLLKSLGDARYAELLATHRRLMRETFAGYGGQEIDTQGDAFFYSFPRARDAVAAAVAVQQAHAKGRWPDDVAVRLRIGLHTGEPAVGDEGYTGLDVVRASRLAAIGRGGQVLLSDTTRAIVADDLPEGVTMRSLGERPLRDIERPEPLTELVIPDVEVSSAGEATPLGAPTSPPGVPDLPDWLPGAARRFLPGGEKTRDMIERRVMDAITEAFEEGDGRRGGRGRRRDRDERPPPPPANDPATGARSVADEIDRLRALRESGALTEEQYARAVDRVLDGGGDAG